MTKKLKSSKKETPSVSSPKTKAERLFRISIYDNELRTVVVYVPLPFETHADAEAWCNEQSTTQKTYGVAEQK